MLPMSDKSQREGLHVKTPLIKSVPFSNILGIDTYLKLENTQPTGTFKLRGIGALITQANREGYKLVVGSSGGNAGLAAAYSAKILAIDCQIVVPKSTVDTVISRLKDEGAKVIVHGNHWCEADEEARSIASHQNGFYIHPFDHPTIWKYHSTLVDEVMDDLDQKPGCFVLSVGGGGLLCGITEGLHRVGWSDVPVICMETIGADCFTKSVDANRRVRLKEITSIAKTLGADMVCEQAMKWHSKHPMHLFAVPDKMVVDSCLKFADDHRMLVEPACGAALSGVYGKYVSNLINEGRLVLRGPVVVIVCGGAGVNLELLKLWKEQFNL